MNEPGQLHSLDSQGKEIVLGSDPNLRIGDVLIHAHDLCPHIFEFIEDTAGSGYLNVSDFKRRILSCDLCTTNVLQLISRSMEHSLASMTDDEIPKSIEFMIRQVMTWIIRRIQTLSIERAAIQRDIDQALAHQAKTESADPENAA